MSNCAKENFYGSMYQYDESTVVLISAADTFTIIGGFTGGSSRGFTFQNGQELFCDKPGRYEVNWGISFNDGNNTSWKIAVFLNGVLQEQTGAFRRIAGGGDIGNVGGVGFLDLKVGDVVDVRIANIFTTDNAIIDAGNLTLVRVGKER